MSRLVHAALESLQATAALVRSMAAVSERDLDEMEPMLRSMGAIGSDEEWAWLREQARRLRSEP